MGEIATGVPPQGAKTGFVFFCYQCSAAFRPLILHRFRHFWSNRRESLSACVHWWKISKFLRRGFSRSPKQPKIWYCMVVCFCMPTRSNGTIPVDRNHLEGYVTSQGCAFCTWLLLGLYSNIGRYKPPKIPTSALGAVEYAARLTIVFAFARWCSCHQQMSKTSLTSISWII